MGDVDRDPELDRKADDPRSDLEQVVQSRADEVTEKGAANTSPLEPAGAEDGIGGTAVTVKNQDKTAQ
jgi:hypothetical protein